VVLTPNNAAPRLLQPPPAAAGQSGLGLATVDYDDHGAIRFAGTAPPGATVRTYVDNQPTGDAAADAKGSWTLVPQSDVAVGDHQLRLDQLGRDGQVTARLELPFQRADLSSQEVAEGRIVVQPGQNLWRIARHAYGRGIQYVVIYQANHDQIRDPNLIYPGQAFAIPAPDAAKRGTAAMPPASSTSR
jgi:nucleoid-associated protein YgaU